MTSVVDERIRIDDSTGSIASGEKRRKVLVVDDDPCVGQVIATMVGTLGYRTTTAEDGSVALTKYETSLVNDPLQIIVSDMIMPRMGGDQLFEETRKLADSYGVKHPYFIGMSGHEGVPGYDERRKGYEMSTDFIQKPVALDKLKKALQRAETYLSSS